MGSDFIAVIDKIVGRIVGYDERRSELLIRAKYENLARLLNRQYKTCKVELEDSRSLSDRQRKMCYALIGEIAAYVGEIKSETKEFLKYEFWTTELYQTSDSLFSLSNASMSVVAAFQSWLIRFIIRNDIPTKQNLLCYVDDLEDYIYSCLVNKKCCVCGLKCDLHHVDRVGMGRDRTDIIHEGMKVLPLCRTHHTEAHTMPDDEFIEKYHICDGIAADKTICKIYGLKRKKENDQ